MNLNKTFELIVEGLYKQSIMKESKCFSTTPLLVSLNQGQQKVFLSIDASHSYSIYVEMHALRKFYNIYPPNVFDASSTKSICLFVLLIKQLQTL